MHDGMDVHAQTYYTEMHPCLGHIIVPKHDHDHVLEVCLFVVQMFGSRNMGHRTHARLRMNYMVNMTRVGGVKIYQTRILH